jgi:3-ketosteroid 9alpha-monooxygenase subunit A
MTAVAKARYPFPRYPTGWFQVAWSDEIAVGEVKPMTYFGKSLVLFRTESGQASVLDAFCPHLGAHLGHGGRVKGETIECPFHAWRFAPDGACAEVPYSKKIPPRASVPCWPVVEKNGCIWVWHDIDRGAPTFEVPFVPEFSTEGWTAPVRREWKIRTHNQETAENVVDRAHFRYLHGTQNMPESALEFDGPTIRMKTPTTMKTPAGLVEGQVESYTLGLGFSTNRFTGLVETLLIGAVAPIDDDYIHLRFTFTVKKFSSDEVMSHVGMAFVKEISRQLEQDKPVWENKVYLDRPLICEGDGPIGQFRRWAAQFYPTWYLEEAKAAYHGSRIPLALTPAPAAASGAG